MPFTTTKMQMTPAMGNYTIGMRSMIQEDYAQEAGIYLVIMNGQH